MFFHYYLHSNVFSALEIFKHTIVCTVDRGLKYCSLHELHVCELHVCELRVCELHVCELHVCELRVCELRVCELRVCELHVCELHVCELHKTLLLSLQSNIFCNWLFCNKCIKDSKIYFSQENM